MKRNIGLITPLLAYHTMASKAAAPATPWYLAGGVSAANCVAAYQPIGAASYAASKVNLANPGTFNITEKNAGVEPSWSAENGWYTYQRADDPTLYATLTGLTLAKSWSTIVMFIREQWVSGILAGYCQNGDYWGMYGSSENHRFRVYWGGSITYFYSEQEYFPSWHIHCVANGVYYRDGDEIASGGGTGTLANPVFQYMGNNNFATSNYSKIAAVAIYNATLTGDQVAAISTAMAAL